MKVIIAGSRRADKTTNIDLAVGHSGFSITEVVSGGCSGIDLLGERWARAHSIPVKVVRARWSKFGSKAGPIRNAEMVAYADALIALPDAHSAGTWDIVRRAREAGLPVYLRRSG